MASASDSSDEGTHVTFNIDLAAERRGELLDLTLDKVDRMLANPIFQTRPFDRAQVENLRQQLESSISKRDTGHPDLQKFARREIHFLNQIYGAWVTDVATGQPLRPPITPFYETARKLIQGYEKYRSPEIDTEEPLEGFASETSAGMQEIRRLIKEARGLLSENALSSDVVGMLSGEIPLEHAKRIAMIYKEEKQRYLSSRRGTSELRRLFSGGF